ncbi:hypothetical protein Patl1_35136 [Pistacia atlantica]|uniref:Uncharacterized protein n=1 Tax=Pistacia atlantica TaxID=434234 RepID=A0ACC0ZTG7_9ROSI|nr:hypothetical protein Patl1_35136 [Pistacia atlantica]
MCTNVTFETLDKCTCVHCIKDFSMVHDIYQYN